MTLHVVRPREVERNNLDESFRRYVETVAAIAAATCALLEPCHCPVPPVGDAHHTPLPRATRSLSQRVADSTRGSAWAGDSPTPRPTDLTHTTLVSVRYLQQCRLHDACTACSHHMLLVVSFTR